MHIWNKRFAICFSVLVFLLPIEVSNGQVDSPSPALRKFKRELAKRASKDQAARIALNKFNVRAAKIGRERTDKRKYFRLAKRASDTDESNLKWLKEQIAKHGFPTPSQLGTQSTDYFYLLLLHADRDREFQKECVQRMREKDSEWPELEWRLLEKRASGPSSREFYRVEDPKKSTKKTDQ